MVMLPKSYYIAGVAIALFIALLLSIRFSYNFQGISHTPAHLHVFDPYAYLSNYKYYPVGVVSYGFYNSLWATLPNGTRALSYNITSYQVTTNAIFGCVNISSLSAYTDIPATAVHDQYLSKSGAGLQLNVNLVVNSTSGESYVYWLQNAILFNTSGKKYLLVDSVNNVSSVNSTLTLGMISGNGAQRVQEIRQNGSIYNVTIPNNSSYYSSPFSYTYYQGQTSYLTVTQNTLTRIINLTFRNYTLPFTYCPIIKVSHSGSYPVVNFGYVMNGYRTFYDNVTLLMPAKEYYFLITPYKIPSRGTLFYDAEFVFGGEGAGENSTFTSLNATGMWLFYYLNGTFAPFPSLYSSGWDTGEHAIGLNVSQGSNYASVAVGTTSLLSNMTLHSSEYNSTEYANVASWIEGK